MARIIDSARMRDHEMDQFLYELQEDHEADRIWKRIQKELEKIRRSFLKRR